VPVVALRRMAGPRKAPQLADTQNPVGQNIRKAMKMIVPYSWIRRSIFGGPSRREQRVPSVNGRVAVQMMAEDPAKQIFHGYLLLSEFTSRCFPASTLDSCAAKNLSNSKLVQVFDDPVVNYIMRFYIHAACYRSTQVSFSLRLT
jgi:hypothetical protein